MKDELYGYTRMEQDQRNVKDAPSRIAPRLLRKLQERWIQNYNFKKQFQYKIHEPLATPHEQEKIKRSK